MDLPDAAAGGGVGPEGVVLVDGAPEVLGYDRIAIDMSPEGVLGKGSYGEVRRGTVDGRPAVFKVHSATRFAFLCFPRSSPPSPHCISRTRTYTQLNTYTRDADTVHPAKPCAVWYGCR